MASQELVRYHPVLKDEALRLGGVKEACIEATRVRFRQALKWIRETHPPP